jgi:hypothetical protein
MNVEMRDSLLLSGGPHVDYRAGRLDAKTPAPPGLPVPPDALKTLSAKFSRAGFSQQDMREMVACGHTIGTVPLASG